MYNRWPRLADDGGQAPYFQSSCSSAKASSSSSSSAPLLILALISLVIFLISFFVSVFLALISVTCEGETFPGEAAEKTGAGPDVAVRISNLGDGLLVVTFRGERVLHPLRVALRGASV